MIRFENIKKLQPTKVVYLLLLVVMVWTTFNIKRWKKAESPHAIINWDVTSYYGYLPATFIHHDLSLQFTENDTINYAFKHQFWPETAPNGGKVIKTTMGMSFMYAPFFFMGHAVALLSKYEPNGFSQPYEFFLVVSCLFYLFIGLLYLRKLLLKYFGEWATSISILCVVLTTNLYYYASTEPAMSHAYSFALIAGFLYYSIIWHENQTIKRTIVIGLLGGLIVLIRPVNLLVFIFPFLYDVSTVSELRKKLLFFIRNWKFLLLIGACAFMVILPQLIYWKWITGSWMFNSYVGEQFYFGNPYILEGLFSYRKGWLIYTPVMVLAILGIVILYRHKRKLFLPVLLFLIVNVYVLYSWWSWWYGGGYGSRPMIDSYALMMIPFAMFLEVILKKKVVLKVGFFLLLIGFTSLNLIQTLQKRRSIIHWDGMSKKAYWNVFLKTRLTKEDWEKQEQYLIRPDYEKARKGEEEYPFELF